MLTRYRYHFLPPHIYISLCVLSWGVVASLQSLTTSFGGLLVLRLLLGVSEAAFSPGVPFYLSHFYRRDELALRAGIQLSAAPLASSFAGSLAWLITWLGSASPIAPWRLLFLVSGLRSMRRCPHLTSYTRLKASPLCSSPWQRGASCPTVPGRRTF